MSMQNELHFVWKELFLIAKCVKVCFLCLRMKTVLISQAEAEKIRKIGEAEASSIEALGKAEAEKMRLKAEAYQQYGEAAKTALVLEALPKVNSKSVHNRREAVCTTVGKQNLLKCM